MNPQYVYVLELTNQKYYVGIANDPDVRFQQHLSGLGSAWTRKYRPNRIIHQAKLISKYDENNMVLNYMEKYGVENVRGGSYARLRLSPSELSHIQATLRHNAAQCYGCGATGHFLVDCPESPTKRRKRSVSALRRGTARGSPTTPRAGTCERCGNDSHTLQKCFARKHVDGYELDMSDPCTPRRYKEYVEEQQLSLAHATVTTTPSSAMPLSRTDATGQQSLANLPSCGEESKETEMVEEVEEDIDNSPATPGMVRSQVDEECALPDEWFDWPSADEACQSQVEEDGDCSDGWFILTPTADAHSASTPAEPAPCGRCGRHSHGVASCTEARHVQGFLLVTFP